LKVLYPGHVRQSAAEAQVLVNLANDSWFLDTIEPNLHLQVCRMRSIENRRDMLRSSNSGYSAVIAADGSIVAQSNLFRRETLSAPYTPRDRRTLYMLLGDWPVYAALALLFGWLALQLRESIQKRTNLTSLRLTDCYVV
jgi:apolipoprotein N-acyltransferase